MDLYSDEPTDSRGSDESLVLRGRMAERELGSSLMAASAGHPLRLDNTEMLSTSSVVLSIFFLS